MADRLLLLACISSSALGILLSVYIHSSWSSVDLYSDISSFWGRDWVVLGRVPYSPSAGLFEYPPVSGLLLYAARMFGGTIAGSVGGLYSGYYVGFSALSLAAAVALGWSTWRLANSLGVGVNPAYFLFPSMLIYGVYNFDLFNALFIVLSIQLFLERRRGWSAAALGVALATKLVAVVLLPIFLLELSDTRQRTRYLVVSLVAAAVFFVPIAAYNFGYFGQFASFFRSWGLEDAWYIWIFQDQFSGVAKLFGLAVTALLLLRVYTLKMPLVEKGFLALASYLLGTYVYAPQFNVMLIPLAAVLALTSPSLYLLETFNALIILTWFTTPNPTHVGTTPQLMALLRSASLALLSVSVASNAGHSLTAWVRVKLGSVGSGTGPPTAVGEAEGERSGTMRARPQPPRKT